MPLAAECGPEAVPQLAAEVESYTYRPDEASVTVKRVSRARPDALASSATMPRRDAPTDDGLRVIPAPRETCAMMMSALAARIPREQNPAVSATIRAAQRLAAWRCRASAGLLSRIVRSRAALLVVAGGIRMLFSLGNVLGLAPCCSGGTIIMRGGAEAHERRPLPLLDCVEW